MQTATNPSQVRKGRFLWMDTESRMRYLSELNRRISDGFFTSEAMTEKLVEDLAPVFDDCLERKAR